MCKATEGKCKSQVCLKKQFGNQPRFPSSVLHLPFDNVWKGTLKTFCSCVASNTSFVLITSWSLSLISCSKTATRVCSWLTSFSFSWHSASRVEFSRRSDKTSCFALWHSWNVKFKFYLNQKVFMLLCLKVNCLYYFLYNYLELNNLEVQYLFFATQNFYVRNIYYIFN